MTSEATTEVTTLPKVVACIGAGYIGGPTMAVLAGHCPDIKFYVVDRDHKRIDAWNSDEMPIFEPGLKEIVLKSRGKNLFFTTDSGLAINEAELIFICVNTPNKEFGTFGKTGFDLTSYEGAARDIAKFSYTSKIVVEKSTVPVRTAEMLRKVLYANRRAEGVEFEVLSNPEFLAEGTAIRNLEDPDRVVIGSLRTPSGYRAARTLAALYGTWLAGERIITTDLFSSELTKLSANAFLAQRISSINALSALAEKTGADVSEIARAIGADHRIGANFLNASVGFGGSCFPKDLLGLAYICESEGLPEVAEYWRQVMKMNTYQKTRFTKMVVSEMFGNVRRKKISLFGFAFKKNTGDWRDTPALDIIRMLLTEQAEVHVYDPKVKPDEIKEVFPAVHVEKDPYEAAKDAAAICVITEWDEFKDYDYKRIYASMMKPAFVFDGRNILDHHALGKIGFKVYAIGKSYPEYRI